MQIKGIDLPEAIIEAQRNGTLVIFAGAGVSVASPSNLPNFSDLADEVADGSLLTREQDEPIDRFLGRLQTQGVKVHLRVKEILGDPKSKPNPLHSNLLSLFADPARVRLVTTNFDRHFTTAVANVHGDTCEILCAPSLPLGHDFNSLVYLHGSVDKDEKRLILTDADFGRAYLTEGWATRFLRDMFAQYVVLFIGYSHDDPVMFYLSRGLTPDSQKRRFALTPEGKDKHWQFLGITPIIYQLETEPEKHKQLGEAIAAWVELAKMGTLDHEHRIKELVEKPPPLDKESLDYLELVLRDQTTAQFFTRHAKTLDWLEWAESKHAFEALFQPAEPVDEVPQMIARWFAENFVCQHPDQALALVQRKGERLNPELWFQIARRLAFLPSPRPEPAVIAMWVPVLINSAKPNRRPSFLEHILLNCEHPADDLTALLVFEHLIRPRLHMETYPSFAEAENGASARIQWEVVIEGDSHWLEQCWKKVFLPSLAAFAERLEPIVRSHLHQAHLMLQAVGKADELVDPISLARSAVEQHEQDHHREAIDTLIDAALNVLEWLVKHKPDLGQAVIRAWADSEVPLLRRLAIHGVTESLELDPDEKIAWLLERDWIYTLGLKHEVFRLLKEAYPKAPEPSRLAVLEQVESGPTVQDANELPDDDRYETYNLLLWLHSAAPGCQFAAEKFAAMQKAHPSFKPREHPDLDRVFISGWGSKSPVSVGELLALDPEEKLDWLLTYKGDSFMGPDREGFLDMVTEAVVGSYSWSWKLVSALQGANAWKTDLWTYILRGWQIGCLSEEQWAQVFTFISDRTELHGLAYPIADLLARGIEKDDCGIPVGLLAVAETIARELWDRLGEETDLDDTAPRDWLTSAINHPAGKLVQFWLHSLSKQRIEMKDKWAGMPSGYKGLFEGIAAGSSQAAELARVVLASHAHFLFSLDADWTKSNILPLLDWSIDQKRAQQAWNGFLVWGRPNERLLAELIPLYEQSFAHMKDLGELRSHFTLRSRFTEHVAQIAVFSSYHPLQDGWLGRFLLAVDSEDRQSWAYYVGRMLRAIQGDSARHLWDRWMRDYWTERIRGVPVPLDPDEVAEMIEWAACLKPVFLEVVKDICNSPEPSLPEISFDFFKELKEKDFAVSHPEALAELLQYLLSKMKPFFWECSAVEEMFRKLATTNARRGHLTRICDEMARLGCPQAADMRRLLN